MPLASNNGATRPGNSEVGGLPKIPARSSDSVSEPKNGNKALLARARGDHEKLPTALPADKLDKDSLHRIADFRDRSDKVRDQRILELSKLIGADLSSTVCFEIQNYANLQILGQYWMERSVAFHDVDLAAKAKVFFTAARQHSITAWEIAVREEEARRASRRGSAGAGLAARLEATDDAPPEKKAAKKTTGRARRDWYRNVSGDALDAGKKET